MNFNRLRNAILALAASPDVQVSLYPGGTCKGDELVLDFDDSLRAVRIEEIRKNQHEALNSLNQLISAFSGEESTDMFLTEEALFSDDRWEEIRKKAKEVLQEFGWALERPERNGSLYVLDRRTIKNDECQPGTGGNAI